MNIESIIEAAILCEPEPLTVNRIKQLFPREGRPSADDIRAALKKLQEHYVDRGIELVEVKSGFRFQSQVDCTANIARLHEKKAPRASRAYLETVAIIAYRQPVSRGEIEEIRGVVVSTQIIRSLLEREWVKVMGYRDVPGKPALYGTTKIFLDHFGLKSLKDLPPLKDLMKFEEVDKQLGQQLSLPIDGETVLGDKATAISSVSAVSGDFDSSSADDSTDAPVDAPDAEDNELGFSLRPATLSAQSEDDGALDEAYDEAQGLFDQCSDLMEQASPRTVMVDGEGEGGDAGDLAESDNADAVVGAVESSDNQQPVNVEIPAENES